MPRYIDADNFRKTMIKRFGCIPCLTDYSEASRNDIPIDDALNLAPTADVVPKIEYDAVVSAVDNSTKEFLKLHDDYQKAKSEVEKLVQDGTRLVQENETLKDNNEHLAVILEETKIELDAMRGAANSYKMHYEKAEAEVKRLHGILLQFTDIVHKWGAKNNIDTSEISLVPILQEEADSIIKKANQELAREIFAEIETCMKDFEDDDDGYILKKCEFEFFMRELKKEIHGN